MLHGWEVKSVLLHRAPFFLLNHDAYVSTIYQRVEMMFRLKRLLNSLANFLIWLCTTLCAVITERIYRRMSTFDCARHGHTRATDDTEIQLISWVFADVRRRRHIPAWWVFVLLALNTMLLPLEIVAELGFDGYRRCHPKNVQSRGVCATPWKGRSLYGAYAAAVLTEQFDWADREWDIVLEGQPKSPNGQEVHLLNSLNNIHRTFLVKRCEVLTSKCLNSSTCGELSLSSGIHSIEVSNWSQIANNASRKGFFSYAPHANVRVGVASLFWERGSVSVLSNLYPNRSRIRIDGIETVLNSSQTTHILKLFRNPNAPSHLVPASVTRTKLYSISCVTDGIRPADLAMAVSIYRSASVESALDSRNNWTPSMNMVRSLNQSDVAKAVYALKSADSGEKCRQEVEMYTTCGFFALEYILPFCLTVLIIILAWVVVTFTLPKADERVPVNAAAWRSIAHKAIARAQIASGDGADLPSLGSDVFAMHVADEEQATKYSGTQESLDDRTSDMNDDKYELQSARGSTSETIQDLSLSVSSEESSNNSKKTQADLEEEERTVHSWQLLRLSALPTASVDVDDERLITMESLRMVSSDRNDSSIR